MTVLVYDAHRVTVVLLRPVSDKTVGLSYKIQQQVIPIAFWKILIVPVYGSSARGVQIFFEFWGLF